MQNILVHKIIVYRYRHKNVVDLMGYVTSPPTIVYEFMDEGSLYDHLHGQVGENTCILVCVNILAVMV